MKVAESPLKEVLIIDPNIHGDHRGWFMETYSEASFRKVGINIKFSQDNHSFSSVKGTLRGLHYQTNPKAQTKLVRCTKGSIFDVAVDIREGSPSYGKWFGLELSEDNKKQLLVPKGFAHGFITLTEDAEVQYKVDEFYSPKNDRSIIWDDPTININWPENITPVLSEKDKSAPSLKEAENNFTYGDQ
ncbi:dTDP-4-dehydrorhamnose 3,5-epimerase [Bacillus sp. SB49]|uniref:dTDP-4-dehydrorhamnose 3,5-epimerase n=1 Tax=Bacillus sp. SB49 TaxID=1071080 RepID=UPI00047D0789|nr:dTDP-4-dehydrorhamnose 3,5-epimerase [Bacillus sp. SB49]QHT48019.1 dTDP-4-dehydrorhamnose 3,5-epimerase [Bacillus sp. SB49]